MQETEALGASHHTCAQGFFRFGGKLAIKTYTEQLESVQSAIAAIETGAQSAEFQGRSWTKADLKVLYSREERLLPLVARESRGGRSGIRVRGITPVDV